jgi:glucokinase
MARLKTRLTMGDKTKDMLFIGVDIGGTKVAAGLVNGAGKIVASSRTRMVARGSAEEGFQAVVEGIDSLVSDRRAKRASTIGISVPGWVDPKRGAIVGAANIPCWHDFPLARRIEARYGLRTLIANDANVAALAEATWGAAKKYRYVFYVTLGTGIGTGIVLDGRIYDGRTGAAGEGGHTTIDFRGPVCGCGKRGCIEAYASGSAIAKRAQERLGEGGANESQLPGLAGGKTDGVTCEIVADAAARGDRVAAEVLNEAAERLAIWLGNIIELFEPDVIVMGGGVGHLMMSYVSKIRETLNVWAINPRWREIAIVEAKYGAESAMVGAAALGLGLKSASGSAKRKSRKHASLRG